MSIDLRQLQREMQRAIMATDQPPAFVHGRDTDDRTRRFGIYTSAYRSRLQEALAHNFPMMHAHLGDAEFGAIASAYVDAHPSKHPSIRTFGNELSRWLERHRSHAPWLAELAQLEWTLGCAFDAPDDAVLSADGLASVEPTQWAQLRFHFARSMQRLTCRTNAPELYEAAAEGHGRCEPQAREWLIWRQQLTARYRLMTATEALALDTLATGETFGGMCASLLEHYSDEDAPLQAAACLKRWLADEVIVTFSLAEA